MAEPPDDIKFNPDDLDRLAAEADDPCQAAALTETATVLRGLSDDDDRDSI